MCACFQLTECCVDVLVTAFKESILAECASMITNNETERRCTDNARHTYSVSDGHMGIFMQLADVIATIEQLQHDQ